MTDYEKRIAAARERIGYAEYILLGAGAGLSAAAGLDYSGQRFYDNFADFHEKYGTTDMYSAGFYPFQTQEEFWAQWARHIMLNRFDMLPTQLYIDLLRLVERKDYFVITTNVESQFEKAGFPKEKIFEVQGNYGYLQCAVGCHDKFYYNESIMAEMNAHIEDCQIPSRLVPKCPVCGGKMDVHVRKNEYFVEDEDWHKAQARYHAYLERTNRKRVVFLELGVGFNTPGIIRYPFELLASRNPNATLIRVNRDYPQGADISFDEDIGDVINDTRTTRLSDLSPVAKNLYLWQGDITTLAVDAIVNAANSGMLGCFIPNHGCIDNVIHTRAGAQLRLECADIMRRQGHPERTGGAKITKAYNLPSKYILHTVGPIITGALTDEDCELLASCYRSCLSLAKENKLRSIAFCCISTGEFHFPQERAAEIAVKTVREWQGQVSDYDIVVVFNVFKERDFEIYRGVL